MGSVVAKILAMAERELLLDADQMSLVHWIWNTATQPLGLGVETKGRRGQDGPP